MAAPSSQERPEAFAIFSLPQLYAAKKPPRNYHCHTRGSDQSHYSRHRHTFDYANNTQHSQDNGFC